jgi:hypothetical protein
MYSCVLKDAMRHSHAYPVEEKFMMRKLLYIYLLKLSSCFHRHLIGEPLHRRYIYSGSVLAERECLSCVPASDIPSRRKRSGLHRVLVSDISSVYYNTVILRCFIMSDLKEDESVDTSVPVTSTQILLVCTLSGFLLAWTIISAWLSMRKDPEQEMIWEDVTPQAISTAPKLQAVSATAPRLRAVSPVAIHVTTPQHEASNERLLEQTLN